MPYKIGISSGFWKIARAPELLGLATKAGSFGATGGVQFNQIDLESVAEFLEPRLKENMKRVQKELGVRIGIHAEIGMLSSLESAERRIWEQAHRRIVETVKNCKELNIEYVNIHASSSTQLQFEESRLRPFGFQYQVVTPDGTPFYYWAEKSKNIKDYIFRIIVGRMGHEIQNERPWQEAADNKEKEIRKQIEQEIRTQIEADEQYKNLPPQEKERLIENTIRANEPHIRRRINEVISGAPFLYEQWHRSDFAQYVLNAGEIDAYICVGYRMLEEHDPLWANILGNSKNPETAYVTREDEKGFNAAIAARYIQGHIELKNHPWNSKYLNGMSVKEWCERNNIMFLIETPEVGGGGEGGHEALYRFYDPADIYHLVKKMSSSNIKICIDFEHMLSQKLDPKTEIPRYPNDMGKQIYLFHLGEPKPYGGTAHIPFQIGSQAQEILYDWLFQMRQKGFKDGILIFERGSGRAGGKTAYDVFENSVWVLRQIGKFLEKDVPPKELPPEFFGLSEQNKETWARQVVSMREHAWDPLEGLLSLPEETHTFLSRSAIEKGKREEWLKRRYR